MKIRARSVRSCGKICLAHGVCYAMRRRPPRGGRGLKQQIRNRVLLCPRRPPRGGRGLKLCWPSESAPWLSRPPRGGRGLKRLN